MITYFHLSGPENDALYADYAGEPRIGRREVIACPISSDHLDGDRRVSDLEVHVRHNRTDQMIVWTWLGDCLVHEALLSEFGQRKLSGFQTRPAAVRFRNEFVSHSYRELIITGWAGVARPESGIRVTKSCRGCHWKRYSALGNPDQLIDWDQWTGDDFFIVWPMPKFILVTERVAETLLALSAASFVLKGLEDEQPWVAGAGFTVGRLSDFMPEELAVRYGRAHGLE